MVDYQSQNTSYVCKSCNNVFFKLGEVQYHKAMTGHGTYEERKPKKEAFFSG
jgi:hypothetical protein